jgi:hypothetical protein
VGSNGRLSPVGDKDTPDASERASEYMGIMIVAHARKLLGSKTASLAQGLHRNPQSFHTIALRLHINT